MRSNVPFRLLIAKLRRDGKPVTALQLSEKTGIALPRMQNLYQGARATLDEWHDIAREIAEVRRTPYDALFPMVNSTATPSIAAGVIANDSDTYKARSFRTQSVPRKTHIQQ